MDLEAIAAGGEKPIGTIVGTNNLKFRPEQNGLAIAVELLSSHTPGAPVVNGDGRFLGFISEYDLLKALHSGKDLSRITAGDLMARDRVAISVETTVSEAVFLMEESRFLNLPLEKNGIVVGCVTRHDLLRAWLGMGLGLGLEG